MDEIRSEMYKVSAKLIADLEIIVNQLDSSNPSLQEIYSYMFAVYQKMTGAFYSHPDHELLIQLETYQGIMRKVRKLQEDALAM